MIYAKNGYRPMLLEHLAEVFPRHVQIHYGQYHREQLFEAARRSRTCAYLADDDHGLLAPQEILLAGCPTVGVKTGASYVKTGATGVLVDRLPPGRKSGYWTVALPSASIMFGGSKGLSTMVTLWSSVLRHAVDSCDN